MLPQVSALFWASLVPRVLQCVFLLGGRLGGAIVQVRIWFWGCLAQGEQKHTHRPEPDRRKG